LIDVNVIRQIETSTKREGFGYGSDSYHQLENMFVSTEYTHIYIYTWSPTFIKVISYNIEIRHSELIP